MVLPKYHYVPYAPWTGHGNDRDNTYPHIVYYFTYDSDPGHSNILKYGISDYLRYGQLRPENQIKDLVARYGTSVSYTIYTRTANRAQALAIEKMMVSQHQNRWGYRPVAQRWPEPLPGFPYIY